MTDSKHLLWKTEEVRRVYDGAIFNLDEVRRKSTDGREGVFVSLDAPRWVTMVPWFLDEKGVPHFKMVRQYRHGSGTVTIEFPAGTVDDHEDVLEAGKRELLEETGCVGLKEPVLLGTVSPNPAFMNNRVWIYFVEGLTRIAGQSLDENEQVDILDIPVKTVIDSMGTGEYDNGIMMIAQAFFLRYASKHGGLL
ncbi:MAG: NUDIX hydrolase [Sphaerochaetaceae bacterium]|nr:NUDIX hydrolase [Sphaerochaetaceae bacterium]MDC7247281.1 NUDIX hydrolase [Sphaerochaetaceae bacterium]